VFPLDGNTGMRLTTAKYYTPSGRSIQNVGIAPDIEVKLPKIKDVKEGESAHVVIREKDLERHLKNETVKEPEAKPKEVKGKSEDDFVMEAVPKDDKDDIQLQKALELLKTGDIFKNLPAKPAPVAEQKEKAK
jgi:carboxyl-terminal processing protease